jgi:hypothetical protein
MDLPGMKKWAAGLGALALAGCLSTKQAPVPTAPVEVMPLQVFYDEEMKAQHGDDLERFIRNIVDEHNADMRFVDNRRFEISGYQLRPSDNQVIDGIYILNKFIRDEKPIAPNGVNVYFLGQRFFFYTRGYEKQFGGLSQQLGDSMLVFGSKEREQEAVSAIFHHEAGHLYGAWDLELVGSLSAYCVTKPKFVYTRQYDAGNMELMKQLQRNGAMRKETQRLINARIAYAKGFFCNSDQLEPFVTDLILHEPVVSNPAYEATKKYLLMNGVEKNPGAFQEWLKALDRQPREVTIAENQALSGYYWRAEKALRRNRPGEAYSNILQAQHAYQGGDGRICAVLSAVEEEALRKLRAAATSPHSR